MNALLAPRNTLWLIASLVLVAAPHAERVPLWLTLLVAIGAELDLVDREARERGELLDHAARVLECSAADG